MTIHLRIGYCGPNGFGPASTNYGLRPQGSTAQADGGPRASADSTTAAGIGETGRGPTEIEASGVTDKNPTD